MEFDKIAVKSITLVDQVEEKILNYIVDQKLTLGSDIPPELTLAENLNVGRNVVREALSRLRMLGIVESRKHKGMVLREPDIMKCFSKVINPYLLSKHSILDLLDFRVSIESGISELIVDNITDEDIKELERIVERHVYQEDMKLKVENEIEFHSKLYRITGNQAIIDFQEMVLPLFNYVNMNFEDFKSINEKNKGKLVKHEDLLIYLRKRDVKGYRKAIYNHLKTYSEYIRQSRNMGKQ
ncbi:MAG: FCD domain-containing protein [Prolixibacteraceae bacterium]